MEEDPPPKPPDPGEYVNVSSKTPNNPQSTPMDSDSTQRGTKRSLNNPDNDTSTNKKTITDPDSAAPSIQSIYTHPSLSDSPKKYTQEDKGPFVVYVSREVSDPSAGASMRAIQFGQFLHKHKISSVLNDGVKNVGRNKVSVEFTCAQAANEFLENPILGLCKYKSFIPTFNITRMGLVRGVPADWHLDEFIESLELPVGCGIILKARRLNRKTINNGVVTWIPTQTLVLTFRGQTLPSKIFSYHTSLPIETYRLPTIQCANCCRFGHIKIQCRSQPRCFKCSQPHIGDTCEVSIENTTCLLCLGKHMATSKSCPEHSRQQSIKLLMSEENLSYQDASSRFPPVRRSFADMAKDMFTPPAYSSTPNPNRVHPHHIPTQSYKKTTFSNPRPRPPQTKGYDRQTHNDITRNCPTSSHNGCALNNDHSYAKSTNDSTINNLTISLNNILHNIGQNPLPSNVAQIIIKIASILSNGCHGDYPMEQSKHMQ